MKSMLLHSRFMLGTRFAALALAATTVLASAGYGSTITLTDYNQGNIDQNAVPATPSPVDPVGDFIAGTIVAPPDPSIDYPGFAENFADYFSFSLAGIEPGSVTSAVLDLAGGQNVFTSGPNGVFNLYLAPSDPSVSSNGFDDVAQGTLIGSVPVLTGGAFGFDGAVPSQLNVVLNSAGLQALNQDGGGNFIVAGTFTGAEDYVLLPGPGGLVFNNVFNGSGNETNSLILTTVPEHEPATVLAGTLLIGLLAARSLSRAARGGRSLRA